MIRYIITALILCGSATAFADTPDAGAPISHEAQEQLREQISTLHVIADLVGQKPGQKQDVPSAQEHKTPADVADRALTLFAGAIAQIAAGIEKAAPELFRVMVQQQYAKAAMNLVSPLGAIIIVLIAGWFLRRIWKLPEDIRRDDGEYVAYTAFARVIPVALALCFGIWFVSNLAESAGYVLNPKYYAVKDLVNMVLNPSSLQ